MTVINKQPTAGRISWICVAAGVELMACVCYGAGRICCVLDEIFGNGTEAVKFTTLVAEPDQPMPPRLQSKTKTSLQLKWNVSCLAAN